MFENRYVKWGSILALLIVANLVQLYLNWGLVTINAKDEPLSQVIRSIEWQAWVKIYTNLPPDTKVTMYVDHVPLAEAMETLAQNVPGRPPGADGDRPDRPRRADGGAPGGQTPSNNGFAGGPPPGGPGGPGGDGGGAPGAPNGQGRRGGGGGFGGGGFGGGGAQWNLAFFVAPTQADVRDEIRNFEAGTVDEASKIYTYATPLQAIVDTDVPISDPRKQAWTGIKPPDPAIAALMPPPPTDGSTPPDPKAPPTVQTYLQAFAESANIWIMAPSDWTTEVATEPAPSSSIIRAVENFISGQHGAVTEAIILRAGRGGPGGGGGGFGLETMVDRLENAVNGLPPEDRPDALAAVKQEIKFYQDLQSKPPDQRRQLMRQHMMERMLYADHSRLSPEKRAARYQRMVAARQAAKG